MRPGAIFFGQRNKLREIVKNAGVHVAGLQNDDGWRIRILRQGLPQFSWKHSAFQVGGDVLNV